MPDEVQRLNAYRKEKGWSFKRLAQAMANVGARISPSTLNHICKREDDDDVRLHDTTLYKIRKFLIHVDQRRRAQEL